MQKKFSTIQCGKPFVYVEKMLKTQVFNIFHNDGFQEEKNVENSVENEENSEKEILNR